MAVKIFCVIAASFFLSSCAATLQIQNPAYSAIIEQIEEKFNSQSIRHANVGVLIKSLKTGEIIYSCNPQKMFIPASNQKILTTAAALLTLGPDFKFKTTLSFKGDIKDSVLIGDLIVSGDGDPTFYNRFYNDPREVFYKWANKLKSKGIKRISGGIIGNDNAFEDNHLGYGWSFDGLDDWYSAGVGALQLNENYVDIKIIPPVTIRDSIRIIPNLPSSYFSIVNNLSVTDTGKTDFSFNRPFGANNIYLNGALKAGGREFEISPTLENPTRFFVTVFEEVLEESGIKIDGNPVDCDDLPGWKYDSSAVVLDTHLSFPLSEILKGLMKRSQNMYAETMVRLLGLTQYGFGSFSNGKKVVQQVLSEFGIEPGEYAYMDGSGLSRYNYISPDQVTTVLEAMYDSRYKDLWISLMPIAGVDGTLRSRMKGTAAEGNVKAKTGTVSNVRSLSGYVTSASGEPFVFSFLVNGHLLLPEDIDKVTDEVLNIIARYNPAE